MSTPSTPPTPPTPPTPSFFEDEFRCLTTPPNSSSKDASSKYASSNDVRFNDANTNDINSNDANSDNVGNPADKLIDEKTFPGFEHAVYCARLLKEFDKRNAILAPTAKEQKYMSEYFDFD
ncbi:hypothetical protein NA57DRAFT_52962 [Rhizodiscina lignyota]|uniref:Uncharacterized protein n=1 Tax=Rhizodiscina lignyota TaxID=1504668 RepID=A0A9P4ISG8_9PEZI|nr:hypothetical protein NA57DRAFT_52962 [Rhizodiscina lignyota]